jgi:hypothetical protein
MATNLTLIENRVQPHVIGCPGQVVTNAVVDALIKFYEETHLKEQGFKHAVTEGDVDTDDNDALAVTLTSYISSDFRPVVLSEFKIDGADTDCEYTELLNDMGDDLNWILPTGGKLFTFTDRTTLTFYGIEDKDQDFYIKLALAPLTSVTSMDDHIYDNFHKAIEAKAIWELKSMPNKDWSNPGDARYYLGIYNDGLALARFWKENNRRVGSNSVKSKRLF